MAAITEHPGPHPGSDDRDGALWQLAAIVESSSDAIISKDLGGLVTSWNEAAERLFGYTAAEMMGRPITTIFPPDRVNEEATILARIGRGEQVEHYETVRRHRDGRDIPVSLTISPIKDADGRIIGASKIIRDMTERQAQERRIRELQCQLLNAQRLTELRQVLLALVHEVAQPLAAIANYVNALRRLLVAGNQEQVAGAMKRIGDQIDRAAQIAQRIREYVNTGDIRMQAEDLAQVIDEIVDLTRTSVREEGLQITTYIHPLASVAEIDKAQIHQVMSHLMRNAAEAMKDQHERELALATRPTDGRMLEISIADRGPGLPEEVRRKLFEPFVTTKPTGMGIGLSLCHAIVETHGGRLWAEDNPGGGSVFRFTVPAAAPPGAEPAAWDLRIRALDSNARQEQKSLSPGLNAAKCFSTPFGTLISSGGSHGRPK